MLHLAACITTGKSLPDGSDPGGCHKVIYQSSEDGAADTIKPRLLSAGADCSKVAFIPENHQVLSLDDDHVEAALKETNARLMIFDPLQAYISSENDMVNAVKMRSVLRKLARIAAKYCCAVVLVGHMSKTKSNKDLYRGLGSIDIAAIARSVLMIRRDPKDPSIRYFYQVKSNLAHEGAAIRFILDRDMGFKIIGSCILDQVVQEHHKDKINKSDRAEYLIKTLLLSGPVASKTILSDLNDIGISERTVRTVAKNIGVRAFRKSNTWFWELADDQDN